MIGFLDPRYVPPCRTRRPVFLGFENEDKDGKRNDVGKIIYHAWSLPRPPPQADRAAAAWPSGWINSCGGGNGIQTNQRERSRRNPSKIGHTIAARLLCGLCRRNCVAFPLGGNVAQCEQWPLGAYGGSHDEHAVHQPISGNYPDRGRRPCGASLRPATWFHGSRLRSGFVRRETRRP